MNDQIMSALSAFTGNINERMFKDLRAKGRTGALPEMLKQAGGWDEYISSVLSGGGGGDTDGFFSVSLPGLSGVTTPMSGQTEAMKWDSNIVSGTGVLDRLIPGSCYIVVEAFSTGFQIPQVGSVASLSYQATDDITYVWTIEGTQVGGNAGEYFLQTVSEGPNREPVSSGVYTLSTQYLLEFNPGSVDMVYTDLSGVAQKMRLHNSSMPYLFSGPYPAGEGSCSCDLSGEVTASPVLTALLNPGSTRFDPSSATPI